MSDNKRRRIEEKPCSSVESSQQEETPCSSLQSCSSVESSQQEETPCSFLQSSQQEKKPCSSLQSSQLLALQQEKLHCSELQHQFEVLQRLSEKQQHQCEQNIRAVFSRLHSILQEEEFRALSALKEESRRQQEKLASELQRLQDALSSLDQRIQDLQEQQKHSYSPQQSPTPRFTPKAGLLLDQAKVLGNLDFRVWRNLRRDVQFRSVLLDPNTAHPKLQVSEDLSSVRYKDLSSGRHQDQSSICEDANVNPERFLNYSSVQASEGFSSGLHQWEVEVGDLPLWALGVVKESAERRKWVKQVPASGLWCLGNYGWRYKDVFQEDLVLQKRPQKIRVSLDYEAGHLTFYDPDHMTHICCYIGTFSEKVFPCFFVGKAGAAKTRELKICEDLRASE